jgi:hypothetical protein
MDWQQKAEALAALGELSIKFREREWRIGASEPWYVQQRVEIKDGGTLCGAYGNGRTPQDAIEDHWRCLVEQLGDRYLVVNAGGEDRRAVRWNGFMWAAVREPEREAA